MGMFKLLIAVKVVIQAFLEVKLGMDLSAKNCLQESVKTTVPSKHFRRGRAEK